MCINISVLKEKHVFVILIILPSVGSLVNSDSDVFLVIVWCFIKNEIMSSDIDGKTTCATTMTLTLVSWGPNGNLAGNSKIHKIH